MSNIKLTAQEIVELMVKNRTITKKSAEEFVRILFSTIEDALINGDSVKLQGLGTFKAQWNEARKSVDVNTGESIIIDGYYKVIFMPETDLKELINEPFAHLEPITLDVSPNVVSEESMPNKTVDNVTATEQAANVDGYEPIRVFEEQAEEIKGLLSEINALSLEKTELLAVDDDTQIVIVPEKTYEYEHIVENIENLNDDKILSERIEPDDTPKEEIIEIAENKQFVTVSEQMYDGEVVVGNTERSNAVNVSLERIDADEDQKVETESRKIESELDLNDFNIIRSVSDRFGIIEPTKATANIRDEIQLQTSTYPEYEIENRDEEKLTGISHIKETSEILNTKEEAVVDEEIEYHKEREEYDDGYDEEYDDDDDDDDDDEIGEQPSEQEWVEPEEKSRNYSERDTEEVAGTDNDKKNDDARKIVEDKKLEEKNIIAVNIPEIVEKNVSDTATNANIPIEKTSEKFSVENPDADAKILNTAKEIEPTVGVRTDIPKDTLRNIFTGESEDTEDHTGESEDTGKTDETPKNKKIPVWLFVLLSLGLVAGLSWGTYTVLKKHLSEKKNSMYMNYLADSIASSLKIKQIADSIAKFQGDTLKNDSLEINDTIINAVSKINPDSVIKKANQPEKTIAKATTTPKNVFNSPRTYNSFIATEIMEVGSQLSKFARKYYGHPNYWVYIYEANRNVIKDPNNVPAGASIKIPKLDSLLIDTKNKESLSYALKLQSQYLN